MAISISNLTISRDAPFDTLLGVLSARAADGAIVDCDYSLARGRSDLFAVSENKLLTIWRTPPAAGIYSVRIRAVGISTRFSGSATFAVSIVNPISPPPEAIPLQGAGPHFAINASGQIAVAQPLELDAAGNDLSRIRHFLPLVRRAADDLTAALNPNQFTVLSRNLADYRAAIAPDAPAIAWGLVFGLGARLTNAADAAQRQIEDRLLPALEDPAQEALQSLSTLHGALIMATAEGRELEEQADQLQMTREQQAAFRTDAVAIADALHRAAGVIEPQADKIVTEAAEAIGEGRRAERGTVFGIATFKHVTIVLVSAATVAAIGAAIGGAIGAAIGAPTGAAASAGVTWFG